VYIYENRLKKDMAIYQRSLFVQFEDVVKPLGHEVMRVQDTLVVKLGCKLVSEKIQEQDCCKITKLFMPFLKEISLDFLNHPSFGFLINRKILQHQFILPIAAYFNFIIPS